MLTFFVYGVLVGHSASVYEFSQLNPQLSWPIYCAYGKAFSNLGKNSAQAYKNYRQQAVFGVNMWTYKMDLVGTTAGLVQMQVDAMLTGHDTLFADPRLNIAKFFMCLIGFIFNIIYLTQRYVLYPQSSAEQSKPSQEPLLASYV